MKRGMGFVNLSTYILNSIFEEKMLEKNLNFWRDNKKRSCLETYIFIF